MGCGSGVALVEMAKAFPRSEFHGFDVSQQMLTIARRNATQEGLANATFYDLRETSIPDDQRFALVLTFDCLHDMTNPHETASAIGSSLQPDGTLVHRRHRQPPDIRGEPARQPPRSGQLRDLRAGLHGVRAVGAGGRRLRNPWLAGAGHARACPRGRIQPVPAAGAVGPGKRLLRGAVVNVSGLPQARGNRARIANV